MRRYFSLLVFLSALLINAPVSAEQEIRFFDDTAYQEILTRYQDKPFILVLWSIECPPCFDELKLLASYSETHADLNLILVATDPLLAVDSVEALIKELDLQGHEHWIYATEYPRKLNYSIDSRWYGELPRSYFFIPCQARQAHSGKLTLAQLDNFYKQAQTTGCRN